MTTNREVKSSALTGSIEKEKWLSRDDSFIPSWVGPSASSQEGAYWQYSELSDTYPMGRHIPYVMSLVVFFSFREPGLWAQSSENRAPWTGWPDRFFPGFKGSRPARKGPVILEDYADPFDAKQTSVTQAAPEKVTENDGYMEPYEAQKMMAEIRGVRGAKEGLTKPLHLYDTPYEPVENGSDSDPERGGSRPPRESRLPQDDERPPEEYDQPWEWKKDRISKAFAAFTFTSALRAPAIQPSISPSICLLSCQENEPPPMSHHSLLLNQRSLKRFSFVKVLQVEIKVIKDLPWPPPVGQLNSSPPTEEGGEAPSLPEAPPVPSCQTTSEEHNVQFDGSEKSRVSPTKEGKARPPQRHSSGSLSGVKLGSLEHSASLGERIDPTLPLENQFWYHGTISRTDAENLLRLCKEASYLVRNSETSKNDYSLSLKSSQGFMHMKLSRTKENKYILGQNSSPFNSVPEVIHFYTSRKLPIKGAEHMSLLYPVAIRTL
ncbi:SHF protein, partial [Polyodon spathula]|nr:SHF protein [Polyodon spathula]